MTDNYKNKLKIVENIVYSLTQAAKEIVTCNVDKFVQSLTAIILLPFLTHCL